MNFFIREAEPGDAEAILGYLKQVGGESEHLTFDHEGIPFTVEEERNFLETTASSKYSGMYLVFENDKLIGNGSYQINPRERLRHRASLALSVKKDYWGQGAGSALLEKLLEESRRSGAELITLEVLADNERAIRLYEKFGFTVYGRLERFFKVNGSYRAALYLYKNL